jgi:hypothetical protein
MRPLLWIGVGLALIAPLQAQPPTLSGVWAVSGEGAQGTGPDGTNWSVNPISGALTLEQKGKDITGTWKGQMPEPWAIAGTAVDKTFDLRTEWRDIAVSRDGAASTARARWVFRGAFDGQQATGTMNLEMEKGAARGQPFKAERRP